MSIQKGHPIIVAALISASDFRAGSTERAAAWPVSISPYARKSLGWWAVIFTGITTRPNFRFVNQ